MMRPNVLAKYLPAKPKRYVKSKYTAIKVWTVRQFFSYTPAELERALSSMRLATGDTVLMHSAFNIWNGFMGQARQVIDCMLNVIGPSGNLLMMSVPYSGSSYDYLRKGQPFDVRATISRAGIISEIFRRRKHVLRSLNPVHPVAALGPMAEWLVADHHKTKFSCGPGSPFEKLVELNGKALLFDVPYTNFSFGHYLEHVFQDSAPIKLYRDDPMEGIVIDANGNQVRVQSCVLTEKAARQRNFRILEEDLGRRKLLRRERIGNTTLRVVSIRDVVNRAAEIVRSGRHFYTA